MQCVQGTVEKLTARSRHTERHAADMRFSFRCSGFPFEESDAVLRHHTHGS